MSMKREALSCFTLAKSLAVDCSYLNVSRKQWPAAAKVKNEAARKYLLYATRTGKCYSF